MADSVLLAKRFEEQRARLRALAYRMLGSLSEAEDAVQEAWLRLHGTAPGDIEDLGAWLTTVVSRICLNLLRSRKARGETMWPEPIVDPVDATSPEHAALLTSSIGFALLLVLDQLAPAERVAFVLHDIFDVPFEDIARIVERSPEATRKLASRARRRVQEQNPSAEVNNEVERRLVEAFLAAAHEGDLPRLVSVLAKDVVLRSDVGPNPGGIELRGRDIVARRASSFSRTGLLRHRASVNGHPGAVCTVQGALFAIMAFTVRGGEIVAIDIVRNPARLARVDVAAYTHERALAVSRAEES